MLARSEVQRLRDELALAQMPPGLEQLALGVDPVAYTDDARRIVRHHLELAETALVRVGPVRTLRNWYSGAAIEEAWLNIHRASETLIMIQSSASLIGELIQVNAAFRASIEASDPRYQDLAHLITEVTGVLVTQQKPELMTALMRSKLRAVRAVANVASDTAHETVRRWRNLLLIAGCAVGALAVLITVIHAAVPTFFSLVPSGMQLTGDAIEPWEIALLGSLGGALAAVLALNRFSGFTDPSGLPVIQAFARVPTAATTSLIGVLLMQTATLDVLKPQNGATVLAYAFFFGYAQEPLLRAIDRRAGMVLNPARSKDEPAKTIPPAAAPPTIPLPIQQPAAEPEGPPGGGSPPAGATPGSAPAPGAPTPQPPPSPPPVE